MCLDSARVTGAPLLKWPVIFGEAKDPVLMLVLQGEALQLIAGNDPIDLASERW